MEYCYYALSGLALRAVDYVSDALVERKEAVVQTFEKPGTIGQHKNNVISASYTIMKGEVPHAHLLQSIPRVKGATEFIRSITLTDKDAAIVAGLGNRALKNHKKKKRSKKLSNTARLKLIEYPRTLKAALQYVEATYGSIAETATSQTYCAQGMLSTAPHAIITLGDGRIVVLYVRTETKRKHFKHGGYSDVRRGQFAGYEGPEEDAARLAFSVELLQEIHPNKAVEGMFFYRFLRKGQGEKRATAMLGRRHWSHVPLVLKARVLARCTLKSDFKSKQSREHKKHFKRMSNVKLGVIQRITVERVGGGYVSLTSTLKTQPGAVQIW